MSEHRFQCRLCKAAAPVWARSGMDATICCLCEPLTTEERRIALDEVKAQVEWNRRELINTPPFGTTPTCEGEE